MMAVLIMGFQGDTVKSVLFPSCSSMRVNRLEPELQTLIREKNSDIEVVYFNKGL